MQALQRRNLAEVRNYLVREYVANNPQHLDEVRELIRQHVNETTNQ
jgi:predicted transcriptional regulator